VLVFTLYKILIYNMPLMYETKIGCGNSLHAFTHNILVVIMILCVSDNSGRTALGILAVYARY